MEFTSKKNMGTGMSSVGSSGWDNSALTFGLARLSVKIGDLLVYSDNLVDAEIVGIVIDVWFGHVVVATQQHGVRTYSQEVISSFAVVAK